MISTTPITHESQWIEVQSFSDLLSGKGNLLSLPGMRLCVRQTGNSLRRGYGENLAQAYAHNPTWCAIIYVVRGAHNIQGVYQTYDVSKGVSVYTVTEGALVCIHDRILNHVDTRVGLCKGCMETFLPSVRTMSRKEISVSLQRGGLETNPGPVNKNQKKGKPKKNGKKGKGPSQASGGLTTYVPRSIGFPDSTRCKMRYIIPLQQVLGGGTTNCLRFTSNAYDVDSALASTAMASFAEYAAVYSRFRTLGMHYSFRVSNSETFPQGMIFGFMTNQLSSTALGQNYAGNKHMRTTILSPVNGSTSSRTLSGSVSMVTLFGGTQPLYDDLFIGSTTSSTLSTSATANCYVGSVSAAIPVAGWFVTGFVELDVLFIRRNALLV